MTTITCDCGRTIRALGWAAHAKACPVEAARVAAIIANLEHPTPETTP